MPTARQQRYHRYSRMTASGSLSLGPRLSGPMIAFFRLVRSILPRMSKNVVASQGCGFGESGIILIRFIFVTLGGVRRWRLGSRRVEFPAVLGRAAGHETSGFALKALNFGHLSSGLL